MATLYNAKQACRTYLSSLIDLIVNFNVDIKNTLGEAISSTVSNKGLTSDLECS